MGGGGGVIFEGEKSVFLCVATEEATLYSKVSFLTNPGGVCGVFVLVSRKRVMCKRAVTYPRLIDVIHHNGYKLPGLLGPLWRGVWGVGCGDGFCRWGNTLQRTAWCCCVETYLKGAQRLLVVCGVGCHVGDHDGLGVATCLCLCWCSWCERMIKTILSINERMKQAFACLHIPIESSRSCVSTESM